MAMTRYLLESTIVGALGGLLFGFNTAVIAGTTNERAVNEQNSAHKNCFNTSRAILRLPGVGHPPLA